MPLLWFLNVIAIIYLSDDFQELRPLGGITWGFLLPNFLLKRNYANSLVARYRFPSPQAPPQRTRGFESIASVCSSDVGNWYQVGDRSNSSS